MRGTMFATLAALAACYSPAAPAGAPCASDRSCPAGLVCVSGATGDRCVRDPALDGPDGGAGASGDANSGSGDGGNTGGGVDAGGGTPTCPRRLLTGGVDIASQGWTVVRSGAGTITYAGSATVLQTSAGARQLLVKPGAVPTTAFVLQFVVEVVASGGHTPNNAAAALMASYAEPPGVDDLRRMVFLDDTSIGWGDGGSSGGLNTHAQNTYRLERTSTGAIRLMASSGSSSVTLSSSPYTTNGTIAVGDQTTTAGLDSTIRIYSIDLLCPP